MRFEGWGERCRKVVKWVGGSRRERGNEIGWVNLRVGEPEFVAPALIRCAYQPHAPSIQ